MHFDIREILLYLPGTLFGFTIHEFCHAYMAYWLGDDTAARQGRLTLNPLVHLDPFGTLMVVFFRFGWARPVPVDSRFFRNPRRDDILVTAAGPVSNLVTAIVLGLAFRFLPGPASLESTMAIFKLLLLCAVEINLMLFFFNLLPIFPLDGARIVQRLLPLNEAYAFAKLEPMGPMILMALIAFGQVLPFSILGLLVWRPVMFVLTLLTGSYR